MNVFPNMANNTTVIVEKKIFILFLFLYYFIHSLILIKDFNCYAKKNLFPFKSSGEVTNVLE